MPRGDKSSYTDKQKRQAEHIEEGYEQRGVPEREAERRAWATVNKETHGGKKSGSGRGKTEDHSPSRKGGRLGGKASASRPAAEQAATIRSGGRAFPPDFGAPRSMSCLPVEGPLAEPVSITSYPKATPSGSCFSNQASAASAVAKTLRWSLLPTTLCVST